MTLEAHCHCGNFRITIPKLPDRAASCNCSWCARTGTIWSYLEVDEVKVISATDGRIYDPNDTNRHHFCGTCSGVMYNDNPEWDPETYELTGKRRLSVNLRMIDDIDIDALIIDKTDGKNSW